jgi:hypothetical protein
MKRRASRKFLDPEDASKIAGVLFAMRSGPPSSEIMDDLRPSGAFAKEVVNALVSRQGQGAVRSTSAKASPAAREVARDLRPLATARKQGTR